MTDNIRNKSSLLTVIITTSITPSAPSTELLSSIYQSFSLHCPFLRRCRVIVTFDGFDKITPKARLKKGCVTLQQAENYELYKQNVKEYIIGQYCGNDTPALTTKEAVAEFGSQNNPDNTVGYTITQMPCKDITFIESSRRLGFGLSVRSALRVTETPFVWIQQHDWMLSSSLPIEPLLQIMKESETDPDKPIKYVCLPATRMLSYAGTADVAHFPTLDRLTLEIKGDYSPKLEPDVKIPLTPMFFWHDKPHVASTAHYLERVFPTRLAMLRGDFIEDKVGQRARAQMKEGQVSFNTYFYMYS